MINSFALESSPKMREMDEHWPNRVLHSRRASARGPVRRHKVAARCYVWDDGRRIFMSIFESIDSKVNTMDNILSSSYPYAALSPRRYPLEMKMRDVLHGEKKVRGRLGGYLSSSTRLVTDLEGLPPFVRHCD